MNDLLARAWIELINATGGWSQASRTRLGGWIGDFLWWVAVPRRRVTLANLAACFPDWPRQRRVAVARQCFRNLARGALDHAVLWQGSAERLRDYVRVEGLAIAENAANRPLIMIAPHFAGLDAGGLRFNLITRGVSIYQKQSNATWDRRLLEGRSRFNDPVLVAKSDKNDLRPVIRALREGLPFYYLPDMDHGITNSVFVPFFGVPAATVPMVSRLARLTEAKVVMAVTEMTEQGYTLHFGQPWADFPTDSVEADTERMNREIERWVLQMPDQYLWTHRRFKTRPPGAPSVY
ncbi:MAG TPA: lipid A biosynthesis acyltransferase [Burkholderiaceae bacterium]|nr:lipid A biosynthesis acyltransferase [Burkholderiaceae bacterium]